MPIPAAHHIHYEDWAHADPDERSQALIDWGAGKPAPALLRIKPVETPVERAIRATIESAVDVAGALDRQAFRRRKADPERPLIFPIPNHEVEEEIMNGFFEPHPRLVISWPSQRGFNIWLDARGSRRLLAKSTHKVAELDPVVAKALETVMLIMNPSDGIGSSYGKDVAVQTLTILRDKGHALTRDALQHEAFRRGFASRDVEHLIDYNARLRQRRRIMTKTRPLRPDVYQHWSASTQD